MQEREEGDNKTKRRGGKKDTERNYRLKIEERRLSGRRTIHEKRNWDREQGSPNSKNIESAELIRDEVPQVLCTLRPSRKRSVGALPREAATDEATQRHSTEKGRVDLLPEGAFQWATLSNRFPNIFRTFSAEWQQHFQSAWEYRDLGINVINILKLLQNANQKKHTSIVYEMLQCSASILENWQTCALLLWWWCRSLRKTANFWENVRRTM